MINATVVDVCRVGAIILYYIYFIAPVFFWETLPKFGKILKWRLNHSEGHSPIASLSKCDFYHATLCQRGVCCDLVLICPSITSRSSAKTAKCRITKNALQ